MANDNKKGRRQLIEDVILRLPIVLGINNGGVATEGTLEAARLLLVSIEALVKLDNAVGNSKEFTYYSGIVAGNPSGNKNVETITYKEGVTTVLVKTFVYDLDDDVLTITNS